jgi:Tol biopolymer transport system component
MAGALAFVRGGPDQGGGKDLLVLDLATGQSLTLVSASQDRLDSPAWSPQGHLLAFTSGLKQINIIKPDGSGRQTIFAVPGGSFEPPVWTSGGKSLVVTDLNFLFQIDLTGKQLNKTPLTSFTGKPDAVSSVDRFLPNPIELQLWAFTMAVPGTPKFDNTFHEPLNALFLFDVRTQKRTRLTPPDMLAMSPCWSRDGRVLSFSGYREPHYQDKSPFRIYRINKDGTGLTELVKGENPSQ